MLCTPEILHYLFVNRKKPITLPSEANECPAKPTFYVANKNDIMQSLDLSFNLQYKTHLLASGVQTFLDEQIDR